MVSAQQNDGNWTSDYEDFSYKGNSNSPRENLVQFCHGSPGAIASLLEATKFYSDHPNTFLNSALKGAENIWN